MASNTDNDGTSGSDNTAKPKGTGSTRKRSTAGTASTAKRSAAQRTPAPKRRVNSGGAGSRGKTTGNRARAAQYTRKVREAVNDVPTWVTTLASVVGVGVAVGAGLFATRNQWMPRARGIADDFNAAFADGETDPHNFDQTRHAGREALRDDPGEEWDDIDDIADASFPASDPPSFSPGKA